MSHIPAIVAGTCTEETYPDEFTAGLVVSVSCHAPGFPKPDSIGYLQYESRAAMVAAYDHIVNSIAPGLPPNTGCDDEGGRGSWTRNSITIGDYACYSTAASGVRMWWTDDELAIMSLATDQEMSVHQIWTWFIETPTGPN